MSMLHINQELRFPEGTDEMVDINKIYIPKRFRKTRPREIKLKKAMRFYVSNGYFDKPISVHVERNAQGEVVRLIMIDEYTRLLTAVHLKVKEVPVKYIYNKNIEQNQRRLLCGANLKGVMINAIHII